MIKDGFWNSIKNDKPYPITDLSERYIGVIKDGIYRHYKDVFSVIKKDDITITIGLGKCFFNGVWMYTDEPIDLSIETPSVRIDAVIIEINKNYNKREATIKIIKGESETDPPILEHSEFINQYPLAYLTIGNSGIITINNKKGSEECPYASLVKEHTGIDSSYVGINKLEIVYDEPIEEDMVEGIFYLIV